MNEIIMKTQISHNDTLRIYDAVHSPNFKMILMSRKLE